MLVTVVHCDLCEKAFAAPGGVAPRAALLMLATHLREQHQIDVRAEKFGLGPEGIERAVWIYE